MPAPVRNRKHRIGDQLSALNVRFMERLRFFGLAKKLIHNRAL